MCKFIQLVWVMCDRWRYMRGTEYAMNIILLEKDSKYRKEYFLQKASEGAWDWAVCGIRNILMDASTTLLSSVLWPPIITTRTHSPTFQTPIHWKLSCTLTHTPLYFSSNFPSPNSHLDIMLIHNLCLQKPLFHII